MSWDGWLMRSSALTVCSAQECRGGSGPSPGALGSRARCPRETASCPGRKSGLTKLTELPRRVDTNAAGTEPCCWCMVDFGRLENPSRPAQTIEITDGWTAWTAWTAFSLFQNEDRLSGSHLRIKGEGALRLPVGMLILVRQPPPCQACQGKKAENKLAVSRGQRARAPWAPGEGPDPASLCPTDRGHLGPRCTHRPCSITRLTRCYRRKLQDSEGQGEASDKKGRGETVE